MCEPAAAFTCRSRQLFNAAEQVIELARQASVIQASASFAEVAEKMAALKRAVEVFDRLNRGL